MRIFKILTKYFWCFQKSLSRLKIQKNLLSQEVTDNDQTKKNTHHYEINIFLTLSLSKNNNEYKNLDNRVLYFILTTFQLTIIL